MRVKSLYMPDTCLQGDKFPAHVVWDKTNTIEITLKIPKSLQVLEIYNVPETSIEKPNDTEVILKDFEVNGYVGFVFKSKTFENPRCLETVEFIVKDIATSKDKIYKKNVELFRPLLKVKKSPHVISIIKNPITGFFEPDQKIKLENIGDGTALIALEIVNEGEFIKTKPHGMESFTIKFLEDFKGKIKVIIDEYPEYSQVLNAFLDLSGKPISLDDETKEKVRKVSNDLSKSLEENENFLADFEKAIVASYVDNLQLITEITSFMEYLNSMGKGRIVLLNSVDVIKSSSPSGILNLKIQVTDLAYHSYPSLEIDGITIKNIENCEVPIHSLFDWNEGDL